MMPVHLKTVENVTVARSQLAFTRCKNKMKTVGNLIIKNSLEDFDAKEMYLHPKNRLVFSKSVEKCSDFIIFVCSHHAVSKQRRSRLELGFQNLPFLKPVLCEREAYLSHLSPFLKSASIV